MTTFLTRETICSAVKRNVLLGVGGEAYFTIRSGIRNLSLHHVLP